MDNDGLMARIRDHAGLRHDAETRLDEIRDICMDADFSGTLVDPKEILRVLDSLPRIDQDDQF